MKIIGAIQAYQEADKIAGAIESLFAAGCDRVVVLDGAWTLPDGSTFGGGEFLSTDWMLDVARAAGADTAAATEPFGGDGEKRDLLIRSLNAEDGDRVFILDADERIHGELGGLPEGHAVVLLRNLRENDLPGIRGTWPHGDYGPVVPLIRWLRWTPSLRCDAPGRYRDGNYPIEPYLIGQLRQLERIAGSDGAIGQAVDVIGAIGEHLTPEQACALPILPGVEIHHGITATEERVAAKRRYYDALATP